MHTPEGERFSYFFRGYLFLVICSDWARVRHRARERENRRQYIALILYINMLCYIMPMSFGIGCWAMCMNISTRRHMNNCAIFKNTHVKINVDVGSCFASNDDTKQRGGPENRLSACKLIRLGTSLIIIKNHNNNNNNNTAVASSVMSTSSSNRNWWSCYYVLFTTLSSLPINWKSKKTFLKCLPRACIGFLDSITRSLSALCYLFILPLSMAIWSIWFGHNRFFGFSLCIVAY